MIFQESVYSSYLLAIEFVQLSGAVLMALPCELRWKAGAAHSHATLLPSEPPVCTSCKTV